MIDATNWTRPEAIAFCTMLEPIFAKHGAHVALTGGLLYREGPRKDLDLIIYRHRQADSINWSGLLIDLDGIGMVESADYGFVRKFTFGARKIDLLFPECDPAKVYEFEGD